LPWPKEEQNEELVAEFESLIKHEESLFEEQTSKLVSKLNDEPNSPWYKQILIDNVRRMIFPDLFVGKLKPLLNERRRGILHIYTIEEQYGILTNYLFAIKIVLPHAWDKRTQNSGLSLLIYLFLTIFQLCLGMYNDFTIESIVKILGHIRKNRSLYGRASKATNCKCVKELLTEVTNSIKKTRKIKL
jgi:hypothetical protein